MDGLQTWNDQFGEALLTRRSVRRDARSAPSELVRAGDASGGQHRVGHGADAGRASLQSDGTGSGAGVFHGVHDVAAVELPGLRQRKFINGEHVYPGDYDLVQGRHLHRPESTDIDVYQFTLPEPGVLSAEVIAERLADSSLLDAVLTLYRQQGGQRQIIARNDDYFSEDSLIRLELDAGTYYVAVTSTGNVDFDPTVEDSGFGGTSEGPYQLRIDFQPRVDNFLVDATGTAFDGNADGVPGGVYNFWFRAVPLEQHVFVDKGAPAEFPDGFGGMSPADGSLQRPFNRLTSALDDPQDQVQSGEILRIIGDGGADGDLSTVGDNLAYELGIANGRILADGGGFVVPQGVTVMVEAGTLFKLLKGNIQVGSSSATIDRSQSALQILGTPALNVIFTSYDDREIGSNSNPRPGQKEPGDWGGIIFQNDIDLAEGRFNYEQAGIFLNFVGQADLRYGGGNVTVDAAQQVVDPIHMIDAQSHDPLQLNLLQRRRRPLGQPEQFPGDELSRGRLPRN